MRGGIGRFLAGSLLVCALIMVREASAQSPGKIFFPESAFDYGVVPQGSVVRHEFVVENKGAGPLTISKVTAQCGCTASNVSKDELQPGERGTIKVVFDTSNFSGDKEKTVTVVSTDPDAQMSTLSLRGRIEPGVLVTPERLVFGEVAKGIPVTREFSAEVAAGSKAQILEARSFSRHLTVREKEVSGGRKVFEVTIGPDVPSEEFRARVTIGVLGNDGRHRDVDVPVFASVKGVLQLTPPVLSLGVLEGTEPVRRSVKLDYKGPGVVKVARVESSIGSLTGTVKDVEKSKGKSFLLEVEADPSSVTKDLKGAVTVTVLNEEEKEESVSLNVYGILPPR